MEQAADLQSLAGGLQRGEAPGVYSASVRLVENQLFFMVREDLEKLLVVVAEKEDCPFEAQAQVLGSFHVFLAELNSANAEVMRRLFPWTAPQAFGTTGISLGLGDRLGLASPAISKQCRVRLHARCWLSSPCGNLISPGAPTGRCWMRPLGRCSRKATRKVSARMATT